MTNKGNSCRSARKSQKLGVRHHSDLTRIIISVNLSSVTLNIGVLAVRVEEGLRILELREGFSGGREVVRYLLEVFGDYREIALLLSPAIIPVRIGGVLRYVAFAPPALIFRDTERVRELGLPIAGQGWVNAKPLLSDGVKVFGLDDELLNLVSELGIPACEERYGCVILGGIDYSVYLSTYLNLKHVVFLNTMEGVEFVEKVRGELEYLKKHHFLLSNLSGLSDVEVSLDIIADCSNLRKIRLLGSTLMWVDGKPLIMELEHNSSVVFCGYHPLLKEVFLRSIFYVC